MYEQLYTLTQMFFKSLEGNLMFEVPNMPNYENCMKATNKSTVFVLAFTQFLLKMNLSPASKIHYMNSTPVSVCLSHRIHSHKVAEGFARRSKSTKSWWYGFKLSGVCDENDDFENIIIIYDKP